MNKVSAQLEDLVVATRRLHEAASQPKNEFLRDSTIQRFEFTFELAWKVMKSVNVFLGRECYRPTSVYTSFSPNRVDRQPGAMDYVYKSA